MQFERVDNDIAPQIALNSLLMWNEAYCLEACAYMFMYFISMSASGIIQLHSM